MVATLAENFEQVKQFETARSSSMVAFRTNQALEPAPRCAPRWRMIRRAGRMSPSGCSRTGIAKAPFDYQLHDTIAGIQRGKKRWPEAIEASSRAIALIEETKRIHWSLFLRARHRLERNKQWDKAEPDFKKALSLLPTEPRTEAEKYNVAHVLNYIVYSWVDMASISTRPSSLLKRAVELQPRDGYNHRQPRLGLLPARAATKRRCASWNAPVDIKPSDPVPQRPSG